MANPVITLIGRVGSDPEQVGSNGLRLRVATSDSKINTQTNKWEDGPTSWWTVKAWKNVADNSKDVIRKGQEIIVVGTMSEETWIDKSTGQPRSSYEINAKSIAVTGYSLTKSLSGVNSGPTSRDDVWDTSSVEAPF